MYKVISNRNCIFLGDKVRKGDYVNLSNDQYASWLVNGYCEQGEEIKETKKKKSPQKENKAKPAKVSKK